MTELEKTLAENKIDLTLSSMGGIDKEAARASCVWGCTEAACQNGGCTITTCMFSSSCPGGPVCGGNGCNTLSGGNTCGTETPTCNSAGCHNGSGDTTCGTGTCSGCINNIDN